MRLHDADVMASVSVAAAVDYNSHEIIHSIWVDCVVGLKVKTRDKFVSFGCASKNKI